MILKNNNKYKVRDNFGLSELWQCLNEEMELALRQIPSKYISDYRFEVDSLSSLICINKEKRYCFDEDTKNWILIK